MFTSDSSPKLGIAGVPYDLGTFSPYSNTGARFSPRDVRDCSDSFGDFDTGIHDLYSEKALNHNIVDFGDISVLRPHLSLELAHKIIQAHSSFVRSNCEIPIFIGGDHSITRSIMADDIRCLIWFDAHTDFGENPEHLHNCVLNNIMRDFPSLQRVYCIGIRRFIPSRDFVLMKADSRIKFLSLNDTSHINDARDYISKNKTHFSIDMDCLDPSFCPDVGYPMPAGLSTFKVESLLGASVH